jgi:hypothetical protein
MPRELTRYFSTAGEVTDANRSDMPLPEQQDMRAERETCRRNPCQRQPEMHSPSCKSRDSSAQLAAYHPVQFSLARDERDRDALHASCLLRGPFTGKHPVQLTRLVSKL